MEVGRQNPATTSNRVYRRLNAAGNVAPEKGTFLKRPRGHDGEPGGSLLVHYKVRVGSGALKLWKGDAYVRTPSHIMSHMSRVRDSSHFTTSPSLQGACMLITPRSSRIRAPAQRSVRKKPGSGDPRQGVPRYAGHRVAIRPAPKYLGLLHVWKQPLEFRRCQLWRPEAQLPGRRGQWRSLVSFDSGTLTRCTVH